MLANWLLLVISHVLGWGSLVFAIDENRRSKLNITSYCELFEHILTCRIVHIDITEFDRSLCNF